MIPLRFASFFLVTVLLISIIRNPCIVEGFAFPIHRETNQLSRERRLTLAAIIGDGGKTVLNSMALMKGSGGKTLLNSMVSMNRKSMRDRRSSIESGIETALFLLDKKQQAQWKKDICKEFPWVPNTILDSCLDSVTHAFSTIAPSELKAALKPGGLEKARPKLESTIVEALEKQPINKSMIPLSDTQKRKLLKYLVTLSLDYVLRDAEMLLTNPFVKLRELEEEKRRIQRSMNLWQLSWYRLRFYPIQSSVLIGLGTMATATSVFYMTKNTAVSATILNSFSNLSAFCTIALSKLKVLMNSLILLLTTIGAKLSTSFSSESFPKITAKNAKKIRRR